MESSSADHGAVVSEGFVDREGRSPIGVLLSTANRCLSYVEIFDPDRRDGDPPLELPAADKIDLQLFGEPR
jgi:hypothetical protein